MLFWVWLVDKDTTIVDSDKCGDIESSKMWSEYVIYYVVLRLSNSSNELQSSDIDSCGNTICNNWFI